MGVGGGKLIDHAIGNYGILSPIVVRAENKVIFTIKYILGTIQ